MDFVVRWLHLSSAAFLFGGALFLYILFLVSRRRKADRRTLLDLMQAYEWGFWAAVGLIVLTGVGNLGRYGDALPGPDTAWGRDLTLKLTLVGAFLLFSAVRSISVTLVHLQPDAIRAVPPALQGMYAGTTIFAFAIVGVAVALAHF